MEKQESYRNFCVRCSRFSKMSGICEKYQLPFTALRTKFWILCKGDHFVLEAEEKPIKKTENEFWNEMKTDRAYNLLVTIKDLTTRRLILVEMELDELKAQMPDEVSGQQIRAIDVEKIPQIENRLNQLESKLPNSDIIHKRFWRRAWTVFGYTMATGLIIWGSLLALIFLYRLG